MSPFTSDRVQLWSTDSKVGTYVSVSHAGCLELKMQLRARKSLLSTERLHSSQSVRTETKRNKQTSEEGTLRQKVTKGDVLKEGRLGRSLRGDAAWAARRGVGHVTGDEELPQRQREPNVQSPQSRKTWQVPGNQRQPVGWAQNHQGAERSTWGSRDRRERDQVRLAGHNTLSARLFSSYIHCNNQSVWRVINSVCFSGLTPSTPYLESGSIRTSEDRRESVTIDWPMSWTRALRGSLPHPHP